MQHLSKSSTVLFGKINMMDVAARTPFKGGAGIDSFWNLTFVAPPSGLVPPYLFGALLSVRTEPATFGLWIYDPSSVVNETSFDDRFADGITIRGSVDFPVTFRDLTGRQGFVALYSTESGNDLSDIGDSGLPPFPGSIDTKNSRYYFAYSCDQLLYQASDNPKEGFGLFGQVSVSDGNPSRLYFSALVGIGGTGMLIPGRSQDNWGIGYYYDGPSRELQDALEPVLKVRDEQGIEVFYNFALTPWFTVGADLQVINPSLGEDTVVIPGLRTVIRF
jgi:porin